MYIKSINLTLEDINYINDELWQSFENFYSFCITTDGLAENYNQPLPTDLISASLSFFEELKNSPENCLPDIGTRADCYFQNFTPIWNLSNKKNKTLMLTVSDMVQNWEKEHNFLLHKGTLFYFWATTDIFNGNYDEGMIIMHKTLGEDRRKDGFSRSPNTPAYYFITIKEGENAYLKQITLTMAEFIKKRLEEYNKRGGNLQYDQFKSKFLDSKDNVCEDLKFYFCFVILRLKQLRIIQKHRNIADDQMAPLIFTGVISDLLLIIDGIFKIALSTTYTQPTYKKRIYFSDHLFETAKSKGWTTKTKSLDYEQEKGSCTGITIETELKNNFDKTIQELINSKILTKPTPKLEADFWLSCGLRNYSAHTISSQKILWENFCEILQSVFNILFLGIEKK